MYDVAMRFAVVIIMVLSLDAQEKKGPPPDPTNLKVLKLTKGPEVIQVNAGGQLM